MEQTHLEDQILQQQNAEPLTEPVVSPDIYYVYPDDDELSNPYSQH
jgi:hypothetical protein